MRARSRWARFRLATVLTLVLGIAIGLVSHQYIRLISARYPPTPVTPTAFVCGVLGAMELELEQPISVMEAIRMAGGLGDPAGQYRVTIIGHNGDGSEFRDIVDMTKPSGVSSPVVAGDIVVVEKLP